MIGKCVRYQHVCNVGAVEGSPLQQCRGDQCVHSRPPSSPSACELKEQGRPRVRVGADLRCVREAFPRTACGVAHARRQEVSRA